ncbi:tyrosine-type recombinase/integrase [Mycoplasmatota bacterium]|nr:tyrosine-type recombinase/integrase [Mycoplasmatota bacterium]
MNTHPLEIVYKTYLLEKDITKESRKVYAIILRLYVNYLKQHKIDLATVNDAKTYKDHLFNRGISNNWIYTHILVLKGFYSYLSIHANRFDLPDGYQYHIFDTIKISKEKVDSEKAFMTPQQAKKIILWTKNNRRSIEDYRNYAIIYLMMTTGLRSIEVRRAKRKDFIKKENTYILYVQSKRSIDIDAYVKITQGVEKAILDYLDKRIDKNPYLFISHHKNAKNPYLGPLFMNAMLQKALKACGLEDTKLTPHALRHSAATFNLMRGGTMESTKKLLRHQSLNTTLIYTHHMSRDIDNSEKEIEKFILNEEKNDFYGAFIEYLEY